MLRRLSMTVLATAFSMLTWALSAGLFHHRLWKADILTPTPAGIIEDLQARGFTLAGGHRRHRHPIDTEVDGYGVVMQPA